MKNGWEQAINDVGELKDGAFTVAEGAEIRTMIMQRNGISTRDKKALCRCIERRTVGSLEVKPKDFGKLITMTDEIRARALGIRLN